MYWVERDVVNSIDEGLVFCGGSRIAAMAFERKVVPEDESGRVCASKHQRSFKILTAHLSLQRIWRKKVRQAHINNPSFNTY